MEALPDRVLAFYGDDFTGSTDAMEVLAMNGLPTVLSIGSIDANLIRQFPEARAFGIAGISRSRSPQWMDECLAAQFESLHRFDAPLYHYKVCSTFDSSPEVGSIGRALDIGIGVFEGADRWVPILIGAPPLGRYSVFGNLFAVSDGSTHRLDRHPTMACHPVTPMAESDQRRHLARQSAVSVELFDILSLQAEDARVRFGSLLERSPRAVLFDVLDQATLERAGEIIWCEPGRAAFAVGSSGLEYALVAYWRRAGLLPEAPAVRHPGAVDRIAVVSGSCSPTTAAQIEHARESGYVLIHADAALLAVDDPIEFERVLILALEASERGRSAVIYTALGPRDPAIADFREFVRLQGLDALDVNAALGMTLGRILREWIKRTDLHRVCVAGGDTSGHVCQALGVRALTFLGPLAPGSPLCRGHSGRTDGDIEIALKGGQVGGPAYFEQVRLGAV